MKRAIARRPTHIPEYAVYVLQTLAKAGLGEKISLGGAFGLLHYLDYRPTCDVDAWWNPTTSAEERQQVIGHLERTLASFGPVRKREWGDVISLDLLDEGKVTFSFQIARRSAQLEPSLPAPWVEVLLDSFADLIASKMVALIERGAPRDFRDIYAVCQNGLISPQECWNLWRLRQTMADSDTNSARARLAIETHLARIVQHRPLKRIRDPQKRTEAAQVRRWFSQEFLDACTTNMAGHEHISRRIPPNNAE